MDKYDSDPDYHAIYVRHRDKLKWLYKRVLARQSQVAQTLHNRVQMQRDPDNRHHFKWGEIGRKEEDVKFFRFIPPEWQQDTLYTDGSSTLKGMLMFQIFVWPHEAVLYLKIVPGPAAMRDSLIKLALSYRAPAGPFCFSDDDAVKQYVPIYTRPMVTGDDYTQFDIEGLVRTIDLRWEEFVVQDLPRIEEVIGRFLPSSPQTGMPSGDSGG